MKRLCVVAIVVSAVLSIAGCSGQKEQYGDKKEDWSKSAPPPEYRGPGQPGGPPVGAATGPGVQPPANPGENLGKTDR